MNFDKKLSPDLLVILVWTILTAVFVLTPILSESYIRTILGIPMVLFIPGYVLIATLFPKKTDLESVERIALSFGLSIAVVPLLGLALNFTFGIRLIPILVTLCLYTIVLIFVAEYRRQQLSVEERFEVKLNIVNSVRTELNIPRSRLDNALTIVLILSIVIAIGMVYFVITTPKIGEKFTEFYVLDINGKADNYQTELNLVSNPNSDYTYIVGVSNHEYGIVNYTMRVALSNVTLSTQEITIDHNQTWEQNVMTRPSKVWSGIIPTGTNLKLEFLLFKEHNFTEPYRNLHLWVNSS